MVCLEVRSLRNYDIDIPDQKKRSVCALKAETGDLRSSQTLELTVKRKV